jgi:hypothetical protein
VKKVLIITKNNMNLYYITEPIEWEDFEEDDDVIDLRAYNIVGGVFHFNLMQLPV